MENTKHTARLLVQDGDHTRTVPIDPLPFSIGRQADRNLSLSNSQVSRQHAIIHEDEEGFIIEDLSSRHGTLINGVRKDSARLRSGDRIQLGASGVVLRFLTAQDQASTRSLLSRISGDTSGSELEKLALFLQHLECGLNQEGLPLADDSKISRSIVRDAALSGQEYLIGDVSGDGQILGRESIVAHELRSVIAIPLRGRNSERLLGLLYLDSRLRSSTLNRVGRDIRQAIATEAANLLESSRMVQAERAADLLRNEMEIAASIQQSIMAHDLPTFPYAKLMAKTVPCTEVGGDFYDVIPLDEGFVAIVADVSGKGMSAALLASIIQGMMYAQLKSGASLVDTLHSVNAFLCSRVSGQKYVTVVALHYKPDGDITLVNGGHVQPFLILEDGSIQPILDGDVPVGLLPNATFHSIPLTTPKGARIVLLSDGITEAENNEGTQFGSTELQRDLAATDPIQTIFTSMHHFCEGVPPIDDRTLLIIDRTA